MRRGDDATSLSPSLPNTPRFPILSLPQESRIDDDGHEQEVHAHVPVPRRALGVLRAARARPGVQRRLPRQRVDEAVRAAAPTGPAYAVSDRNDGRESPAWNHGHDASHRAAGASDSTRAPRRAADRSTACAAADAGHGNSATSAHLSNAAATLGTCASAGYPARCSGTRVAKRSPGTRCILRWTDVPGDEGPFHHRSRQARHGPSPRGPQRLAATCDGGTVGRGRGDRRSRLDQRCGVCGRTREAPHHQNG